MLEQKERGKGMPPIPGVPECCPAPEFHFCPPGGYPHLLGFRFPEIPGVPPILESHARRVHAAATQRQGTAGQVPLDEWQTLLGTIGGEFDRADYHLARFHSVLEVLKARRRVAGGPVFSDPGPARALYSEAASYLGSVRTIVDIIVYAAARRAGTAHAGAERWEPAKAIASVPQAGAPPSKYDVDDMKALRKHAAWFETLNVYRNCMQHRGWHEARFGYFEPGDTAPEADNPAHNVMLVPDPEPLKKGARPGSWTYTKRRWLDALVREIETGFALAMDDLLLSWDIAVPPAGKVPLKDQPTVFLTVPFVAAIEGQSPPALHVFLSKLAARLFLEHFEKRNLKLQGCTFRALRRTTLAGEGTGYLIAYDSTSLGTEAEVHLVHAESGRVGVVQTHRFNPLEQNGPAKDTLWLKTPTLDQDPLYVLAYVGK